MHEHDEWIRLTPDDVTTAKIGPLNGVSYSPSPYNLPIAMRVSEKDDAGRRVIEFQYLDGNEPAVIDPMADRGIGMALGKRSHRIFRVFIDEQIFANDTHNAIRAVTNAILNLRAANPRTSDNLDATCNVVSRFGERLLSR